MRKARAKKRIINPDLRYNDILVSQFVNNLMVRGQKDTAYKIFYDSMDIIEKKNVAEGLTPLEVWKKAIENVTPQVEVRSRKVGGSTFQIPQAVRNERKLSLSMKWLISYSRDRKGKPIAEKLADEILAAFKEEGGAFKKKTDIHKMAEANKAYSHLRL